MRLLLRTDTKRPNHDVKPIRENRPNMADEEENLTLTVITESEDRAALEDIRDTKGNSNKTPAALKHFNNFLAIY